MMLTWSQITDGKKILTCINISPLGLYAEPTIAPDGDRDDFRKRLGIARLMVGSPEFRCLGNLGVLCRSVTLVTYK